MKNLKSDEEVRALLKIDNWREISKDKITDFINQLPTMKSETAVEAIKQFPNHVTLSNESINALINLCKKGTEEITKGTDKCMDAYLSVLESLKEQIKDNTLSQEERDELNNKMIEVVKLMSAKDSEKNQLINTIVTNGQKALVIVVSVAAGILGYNIYNKK